MKKFLVIFLLSYLWFSISNAGLEEPGKNNFTCAKGALDGYKEAQDYKKKKS